MSNVGKEVIKTVITLVTTAFGLVAGLAWNDAIQALISQFFEAGSALTGQIVYAVIVTSSYWHRSPREAETVTIR